MKFEDKIKRIDEISEILDEGNVSLDEMTKLYEEGLSLASDCRKYLEKAELKIIDITNKFAETEDEN
ncbi:MAG: exodeoxyribonuclease VII small subunit [Desulfobulbaceae bacterium]|nr:exodeoxyribonuclease VII small subunit [Candidatus Kapabacteria bacterium]MBS4001454.1 exodeoxyribonuclease VII small subunit [Desulfobulbaceae bacterium]